VPDAAVIHVHPATGPALKKPSPSLISSELLTNQVVESEMLWTVMTPLELNAPCAKNWLLEVLRVTSVVVSCVHRPPTNSGVVDGACVQIRIPTRVIGVDVGDGDTVLELPPQLSSSVVTTKASTGATTKHFFCHIKHPAMPWRLRRCQAHSRENQTNYGQMLSRNGEQRGAD